MYWLVTYEHQGQLGEEVWRGSLGKWRLDALRLEERAQSGPYFLVNAVTISEDEYYQLEHKIG